MDVDINTLNFDIEKEAITDNTKAIFAVNLLGNPNDFETIESMIKDKNILLIEDNCESIGLSKTVSMLGHLGKWVRLVLSLVIIWPRWKVDCSN